MKLSLANTFSITMIGTKLNLSLLCILSPSFAIWGVLALFKQSWLFIVSIARDSYRKAEKRTRRIEIKLLVYKIQPKYIHKKVPSIR